MSLKSFLRQKTDTIGYGLACIVLSAFISFLVSSFTINHGAKKELKAALFKDDIPVLNRVSSMWEECVLCRVVVVSSRTTIEKQPVVYLSMDGQEVSRDTLYNSSTVSDTSVVFVPKFVYQEHSYDVVCDNLNYIREHISLLSPETYISVNKMISYMDMHPVARPSKKTRFEKSEWVNEEVYAEFYELIGEIYASYIKRQRKFL